MKDRFDATMITICQALVWVCLFVASYSATAGNEAGVIASVLALCGFVGVLAAIVTGRPRQ